MKYPAPVSRHSFLSPPPTYLPIPFRSSLMYSHILTPTYLLPPSLIPAHPIPLISYVFPYTYSSFFNTLTSHSAHLLCSPHTYVPFPFRSSIYFFIDFCTLILSTGSHNHHRHGNLIHSQYIKVGEEALIFICPKTHSLNHLLHFVFSHILAPIYQHIYHHHGALIIS